MGAGNGFVMLLDCLSRVFWLKRLNSPCVEGRLDLHGEGTNEFLFFLHMSTLEIPLHCVHSSALKASPGG